ncbi:MAG: hypothetical protein A2639_02795 [Candidatus Staskawiczbacteria bacterium RIFCSPHIGHO2_01_FULL_34_27]|uniref:Cell division protein FtsZ n=2 Tax=Candidatus Staskawicziibacteriota TaxID=1817916 RepID=A0A1G2HKJ5_9BACT|nr:MAG: hypothetical protein A2639_02795 [Candidatus Staskawiczbacteria bacterium RIFCSPHIGHO2_01_FULL_34_27]OGZ69531.1 MAG: hypothetical protein A3D35_01295 [Candidatus Staskawiczbacteria bacterium RIFCSPHIGHO2_02_FULL_34_9]
MATKKLKKSKKPLKKKVVKKANSVKTKKTLKKKVAVSVKRKTKKKIAKKITKKVIVKKKFIKKNISKPKKKPIVNRRPLKAKKAIKPSKKVRVAKTKSNPVRSAGSKALDSFLPNNLFRAKIKVIGIGGGGGAIVSEIGKSLGKANFVIADTDSRFIKKNNGIKHLLFGQELTHGLGTGLNPELARIAAENEREKIEGLFENQDIVILVASLGGGVGSGATEVFAEISKKFDCITFGIFTLPFKFEGSNKHKIAQKYLSDLRNLLNVSVTIPNERIFKIIDESTSITQAFSMINKNLIRSLESLIDLIYSPGVINIDFADLRSILQGKGNLAFLNTVEASGKDSSEKIMNEILNNPLYQNNNFTVEKILFNIAGGNNLSMMEVDKISRMIAEQNQKAKIIFGISKSSEYKNKIKTTLLMTGPSMAKEAKVSEKKEIQKEIAKKETIKKVTADDGIPSKGGKKPKKVVKKNPIIKKKKENKPKEVERREEVILNDNLIPAFNSVDIITESAKSAAFANSAKLSIVDVGQKKAIRRSALEIKRAEEEEAQKQSQQEKEWEIPAFLRFKK